MCMFINRFKDYNMSKKWRKDVKYDKNKNIQITFTIRESLYYMFKTLCKAEKKMPATVIKDFIQNYVDERKEGNDDGE